jgi:peroxidase
MVYGSTKEVNTKLRTFEKGKLKTSTGDLLPVDWNGHFYAGDARADENMGLTTLQILFLREHNRLCDLIAAANQTMSDQEIFNTARNYVIGLIQKISYFDYLPNLFGNSHFNKYVPKYTGYNSSADPTIFTEFSSTVYRIGHPYIPHTYKAVDNNNVTVEKINLLDLLVSNPKTLTYFRVNTILKGLAFTLAKERTLDYVDELRDIPASVMGRNYDLFSINTDRNRDHGVSDYNSLREAFGLKKATTFE